MGGLLGAIFGGRPHYTVQDGPRMAEGRPGMEYPELQPNLNPNDPYLQPQAAVSPGSPDGRPSRLGFFASMMTPGPQSMPLHGLAPNAGQTPPAPPAVPQQGWTYVAGKGPQWTEQDPFGNTQAPKKPFTGNRV